MTAIKDRASIRLSVFCLGVFSTLAQVVFVRELLVVFLGNELSIGILLACWLAAIGVGAFAGRYYVERRPAPQTVRDGLTVIALVLGLVMPLQVLLIRWLPPLISGGAGEYVSLQAMAGSAFVIFFPACFGIGFYFPLACRSLAAWSEDSAAAVSGVYGWEAMGSMLGGILLTYFLLPVLSPFRLVLLGMLFLGLTAGFATCRRRIRTVAGLVVLMAGLLAAGYPAGLKKMEAWSILTRWRATGLVGEQNRDFPIRVRSWRDTIYQNLVLLESQGQFSLFGNGQVLFDFPDPITSEHDVHFVMAQNPGAQRVLLIGGNPVGDIPELLKYPLAKLTYVEVDAGIGAILKSVMPEAYDAVFLDRRVDPVVMDGVRFVMNCRETFDVVLVQAPEPATAAANRFYTREFYEQVRRLLSARGFLYTGVQSAERLRSEAVDLGASVYQTLKAVFPVVHVTAEARNRFFAGGTDAPLTFSRVLLAARSDAAQLSTEYFQPEYFLGCDEIAPEKMKDVRTRFESATVPLNTILKPVTFFYNLVLWSRYSDSGIGRLMLEMKSLRAESAAGVLLAAGLLCVVISVGIRLRTRTGGKGANRGRWTRTMTGWLVATTGFCGMALELVIIFLYQSLYGYIYERIGMIVAVFMLGLVLGVQAGRRPAGGPVWRSLAGLVVLESGLLALAVVLPAFAAYGLGKIGAPAGWAWGEGMIGLAVCLLGALVGAEFALANRLYRSAGGARDVAAAVLDASDHGGAALGALLTGILMVPVFGIGGTCMILAGLKMGGLLILAAAVLALPRTMAADRDGGKPDL